MGKRKRKLSARERSAKKKRNLEFMIVFINGKQKRVRREPTIDGMPVDEFMMRNAGQIWLHQNEMWEEMQEGPHESQQIFPREPRDAEDDIPF